MRERMKKAGSEMCLEETFRYKNKISFSEKEWTDIKRNEIKTSKYEKHFFHKIIDLESF